MVDSSSKKEYEEFMREISLMREIGSHPCIVNMLACVTKPYFNACIVMDYCGNGDLLTYVRSIESSEEGHRIADRAEAGK